MMRSLALAACLALGSCAQVQALLHPTAAAAPAPKSAAAVQSKIIECTTPPALTVRTGTIITIEWQAVTTLTDGTLIPKTTTVFYKLYTPAGFLGYTPAGKTQTQRVQEMTQSYYLTSEIYVNGKALESARTAPVCVAVLP
jgi:hypothetical protein